MVARIDTSEPTWAQIHAQLSKFAPVTTPALNGPANPDLRPTDPALIARLGAEGWVVEPMRWGLVPYWWKGKPLAASDANPGFTASTFNARVETVWEKPAFKQAIRKRRCVVPAAAWFEWTGPAWDKVKHRLERADGQPLWFAGLWDSCLTADAGEVRGFTVLVGPATGDLVAYHDRAPVVLDTDDIEPWLAGKVRTEALFASTRPERFAVSPA